MAVYFIQADGGGPIKIGHAVDPVRRYHNLQIGSHEKLRLRATIEGGLIEEAELHAQFAFCRLRGEWFSAVPELVGFIERLPPIPSKVPQCALDGWLAKSGITRRAFARNIGVAPSVVTDLCSGRQWMTRQTARAIERETRGEVTAADFVHLGARSEAA